MKKYLIILLCFFIFAGCAGKKAENKEASAVDVDLTSLSSTMVYSEVYNMMQTPEEYLGKTIKAKGTFTAFQSDDDNEFYFACLIADATACCSQGLEFKWKGEHTFPDDYPIEGTDITVTGKFDVYEEDGDKYLCITDAELEF